MTQSGLSTVLTIPSNSPKDGGADAPHDQQSLTKAGGTDAPRYPHFSQRRRSRHASLRR